MIERTRDDDDDDDDDDTAAAAAHVNVSCLPADLDESPPCCAQQPPDTCCKTTNLCRIVGAEIRNAGYISCQTNVKSS